MKRRVFNQITGSAMIASHTALKMLHSLFPGIAYEMKHLRGNVGSYNEGAYRCHRTHTVSPLHTLHLTRRWQDRGPDWRRCDKDSPQD